MLVLRHCWVRSQGWICPVECEPLLSILKQDNVDEYWAAAVQECWSLQLERQMRPRNPNCQLILQQCSDRIGDLVNEYLNGLFTHASRKDSIVVSTKSSKLTSNILMCRRMRDSRSNTSRVMTKIREIGNYHLCSHPTRRVSGLGSSFLSILELNTVLRINRVRRQR